MTDLNWCYNICDLIYNDRCVLSGNMIWHLPKFLDYFKLSGCHISLKLRIRDLIDVDRGCNELNCHVHTSIASKIFTFDLFTAFKVEKKTVS